MTNLIRDLVVVVLIFWVLGVALNILGGLIHILLVVALAAVVWNLITGKK